MEQRMEIEGGGTLLLCRDGPRVRLEAEYPWDGKGLYKVWLRGDRGGRLLLGTMVPEGGRLRLKRTLSVSELERAGCWPELRGEVLLSFSFGEGERWYCERDPARLVSDPVLKHQLRTSMLCRRSGEGFCLAAPFRTSAPVLMNALFCLGQLEKLEGGLHLVWEFDRNGNPKNRYKEGGMGHTSS